MAGETIEGFVAKIRAYPTIAQVSLVALDGNIKDAIVYGNFTKEEYQGRFIKIVSTEMEQRKIGRVVEQRIITPDKESLITLPISEVEARKRFYLGKK
jgi:hypothetical protein